MKAIICTKYGQPEVLQFTEMEKTVPKDNEVEELIYEDETPQFAFRLGYAKPVNSVGNGSVHAARCLTCQCSAG